MDPTVSSSLGQQARLRLRRYFAPLALAGVLSVMGGLAGTLVASIHSSISSGSKRRRCPHFRYGDRKSTRLNSSHSQISYAVFCLTDKRSARRIRTPLLPQIRYATEPVTGPADAPRPPSRPPPTPLGPANAGLSRRPLSTTPVLSH